jgi:uncharacterized membrane protein YidH (DUF202 family)
MGWLSEDKEDYISKWQPKDFMGLLWLLLAFIVAGYVIFQIAPKNEILAAKLIILILGLTLILCSKAMAILSNLNWIASPFSKRPLSYLTPQRSKILGAILVVFSLCVLLFHK